MWPMLTEHFLIHLNLPNVFFRSRQEFIIQESTGKKNYANYAILINFIISLRFSAERE